VLVGFNPGRLALASGVETIRHAVSALIFLSHWGEDGSQAVWLASHLERRSDSLGTRSVHVFVTSDPADRFKELRDTFAFGEDWASRTRGLGTRASAIPFRAPRWEIHEGTNLARTRGIAFVPCLLGVGFNALWDASQLLLSVWQQRELGPIEFGAPEAEFQALTLEGPESLTRLTEVLRTRLSK
jgi:hypothetical protein